MKIALVHNWPGIRNAEFDLIGRMQLVLASLGHESVIIDPFGLQLTQDGQRTHDDQPVNTHSIDFCLYLHFNNPHLLDCFSYAVNWNPTDYLVREPSHRRPTSKAELAYFGANLSSHDVILSAGSPEADQLAAAIGNRANPHNEFPELRLHTSCPIARDVEPISLDQPKLFYIGMNWERLASQGKSNKRHGGLLESLDATGRVAFYGVNKVNGIETWKGFKHYYGELPFDGGQSIIRTANRCGVSLVLSSVQHRNSGLVSMRVFQACAARSVIICDDNRFLIKHFGDAVLSFEYSDDPQINFQRINQLMDWIEQHPEEAKQKAERAHRIFVERFAMEQELANLIDRHPQTLAQVAARDLPESAEQTVDVVFDQDSHSDLHHLVTNLQQQRHVKRHAIIWTAESEQENTDQYLADNADFAYTVLTRPNHRPSSGALLLQAIEQHAKGDVFCLYQDKTHWHRHHLAWLLRCMTENDTDIAQSHLYVNNQLNIEQGFNATLGRRSIGGSFNSVTSGHILGARVDRFSSSAFMFRRHLLLDAAQRAEDITLFTHAAAFYLVMLNYLTRGKLPSSTGRISFRQERDDESHAIYDLRDTDLRDALRVEKHLLTALFSHQPRWHELSTSAAVDEDDSEYNGVYDTLVTRLAHRPTLKRIALKGYDTVRFLLRKPPYPPRKKPKAS